jgi:membrane associated rhomboid family serine protease
MSSESSAFSTPHTVLSEEDDRTYLSKGVSEDEDFLKTKQEIAFLSIGVTAIQLLTICLQFAMCGIAPLDVNPFVGPYPDAFSEWGGKNGYLMINNKEYWRIISPAALSVGILHLLANAFCQLEPVAIFEREWGSFRWMLIYVLSSVGCNTLSVYVDPDSIAVGSSGSLMGLFAAKLAQVMIHTLFDVNKASQDEFIRLEQLSSVVFGLVVISVLSFFTFIDWSGHLGGLMAGFFAGMVLFSNPIRSCCVRFLWTFLGLSGLVVTLTGSVYLAITESTPSEDLADACTYFRSLYAEDVECGCLA